MFKTTICKVSFIIKNNLFIWKIHGTVVAKNCSADKPCVIQSGVLEPAYYKYVFGSTEIAEWFIKNNKILTRKLRLTTLGYDKTDRVIVE